MQKATTHIINSNSKHMVSFLYVSITQFICNLSWFIPSLKLLFIHRKLRCKKEEARKIKTLHSHTSCVKVVFYKMHLENESSQVHSLFCLCCSCCC